jgi:hypothetical protein
MFSVSGLAGCGQEFQRRRSTMMRTNEFPNLTGTSPDLLMAAELGARIAARKRRAEGYDDESVRRGVIAKFDKTVVEDGYNEWEREALIAAVQRAIDEVLAEQDEDEFD